MSGSSAGHPSQWEWVPPELAYILPLARLAAACEADDRPFIKELLTERPDALDGFTRPDAGGWVVPVRDAVYNGSLETVAWLLGRGAKPDSRDPDGGGNDETALRAAAWDARSERWPGDPGAADLYRIIRLLIDAGADPHAPCHSGRTTPDQTMRDAYGVSLLEALAEFERQQAPGDQP